MDTTKMHKKFSFRNILEKIFLIPSPPMKFIKPRWLSKTISIMSYISMLFFPAACFVYVEYVHYANKAKFFTFITERISVVAFDLALLYLIFIMLLLIFRRAWVPMLLMGGFCVAASMADYLKFLSTGDYFYPWDIAQAKNIGLLTGYVSTPVPPLYIIMGICLMLFFVLAFIARTEIPLRWFVRIPAAAVIAVFMLFSVSTPQKITDMLNSCSMYLEDMASQDSNYTANGFVGAFSVNVLSSNVERPDGYSEESVSALLSDFSGADAAEDFSSPDIILVLSESFWDIRRLSGTEFSQNPLKNYDEVTARENCVSGNFFTTGFGGGTVRPDFEVLTGLSTDYLPGGAVPFQYVNGGSDSYLRPYLALGYRTLAVHPYLSSFYQRKTAYPNLGFQELYFSDSLSDIGEVEQVWRGNQISDETFVDYIEHFLSQSDGKPTFMYGISMENHQPYDDKFSEEETYIDVKNSLLDAETLSLVKNFTQGVGDADAALGRLADYADNTERPTVIVWFGDHAPTLGTNYAAYAQSGTIADNTNISAAERLITQSTPYLIYSNFKMMDSDMVNSENHANTDVASYNLMNLTASLIGAPRTPLMDFLAAFHSVVPNYNVRMRIEPDERMQRYIDGHRMVTYDRLCGEKYSEG